MLTKQEVFDKMVSHLLMQNKRCKNYSQNACLYRGPDGMKCAVGALIDDAYYDEDFEGLGVFSAERHKNETNPRKLRNALINSGVDVSDESIMDMLEVFQMLHDEYDPESWPSHFEKAASDFGVEFKGY